MSQQPLLQHADVGATSRERVHTFLEVKTPAGLWFEYFTILLICLNVVCFILSTDSVINDKAESMFLGVEYVTTSIFTLEYLVRLWAVVESKSESGELMYLGCTGRFKWAFLTFYSWVDLASIIPSWIDLALPQDLPATQFIRLLRLFRMMRVEGRYLKAFTTFGDIFTENKELLATSGFVGLTTWIVIASLYYLAERDNEDMIWVYDSCRGPGEPPDSRAVCENRFRSIANSLYFTLLNLFGEFPLIDEHSTWGRVIASFTSIVACAVFAIPTGIFGSGFEQQLEKQKAAKEEAAAALAAAEAEAEPVILSSGVIMSDSDDGLTDPTDDHSVIARLLNGEGSTLIRNLTFVFVILDVIAFMFSTVRQVHEETGLVTLIRIVEVSSTVFMAVDFFARLYAAGEASPWGRPRYLTSFKGLVDLLSWLPAVVGLIVFAGWIPFDNDNEGAIIIRYLALIRMFKTERFVGAFAAFDDILSDNLDLLAVTGFAALVTWVFASTLMYYAEKDGPDSNTRRYYTSIPEAMWMTLLNLSGESPLCDYTPWGKLLTGLFGIFAVGWFGIPVGILGAGFEDWVGQFNEGDDGVEEVQGSVSTVQADDDEDLRSSLIKPKRGGQMDNVIPVSQDAWATPSLTVRQNVFRLAEARTRSGKVFEVAVILLILVTVVTAIVSTVPSICPESTGPDPDPECPSYFDVIEYIAVIVFSIEYILRVYSAPEFREYANLSPCVARLRYVVSFYALIDFIAVAPWYLARVSPTVDKYDNYLRLLRLLRLLKVDKWVPSVSLIDDVFRAQARGLLISGFASLLMWMLFAGALFLSEKDNHAQEGNLLQSERFESVPNALQYNLILLSGDYPIVDFTFAGKLINIVQLVVAVGVVAVPSGLIASGFTAILEENKEAKHKKRRAAAACLQKHVRGFLARRKFYLTVQGAVAVEKEAQAKQARLAARANRPKTSLERAQFGAYRLTINKPLKYGLLVLIILNVIAVIVQTEPAVQIDRAFEIFEWVSIVVFTLDYALRMWSAPLNPAVNCSRAWFATSFFGVVDLLSILPFIVDQIITAAGGDVDSTVFRVFRLFRILQLERFVTAFTLLDNVFWNCKDVLAATGLLALVVWVFGATLFWLFEKGNDNIDNAFDTIPGALYYTAVFFGGEWGQIDFTPAGKVLCSLFVLIGIALFAIPVGTIFEAFGDVLAERNEEAFARKQKKLEAKEAATASLA